MIVMQCHKNDSILALFSHLKIKLKQESLLKCSKRMLFEIFPQLWHFVFIQILEKNWFMAD